MHARRRRPAWRPRRGVQAEAPPWFVIFPARPRYPGPLPWTLRLLHPAWRHCYLARADGPDRTIAVEHGGQVMLAETFDVPVAEFIRFMGERQAALILFVPDQAPSRRPRWRGPMSCVEATKAAIGIAAPWIITPRQLARHLRRRCGALTVSTMGE